MCLRGAKAERVCRHPSSPASHKLREQLRKGLLVIRFIAPDDAQVFLFTDLRKAARKTRNPARNELIILMLYRHGLRVSELCHIKLEQLNLDQATVFVKRSKNGIDGMHPIAGDELRLLRRYLRERESELPWLFVSERGSPLARSTVNKLLEQCSDAAALPRINPHMLRHGCGFYMINNGYDIRAVQIYLGHVSISNTAIYARFNEKQFVGMWE